MAAKNLGTVLTSSRRRLLSPAAGDSHDKHSTSGEYQAEEQRPCFLRPVEFVPGRLYTTEQLRAGLPETFARLVISRCRMVGGRIIGQAIIEVLTRFSLSEDLREAGAAEGEDRMPSKLMTLAEAAEYLRVSERTVRRLVDDGVLIAQNIATPGAKKALLRFTKESLDRDMKKAETSLPTPPPTPKFRLNGR